MPGWSPYGLPGKCEMLNLPGAWNVRTSELYHLSLFVYGTPISKYDRIQAMFPAFSINCMLPPSPSSLVILLSLGNYVVALSVARVKPGGFSPTISNYIFTSPRSKLLPLVFCPLGRGARGHHRKTRKAHFAFVVFHGRGSEWYTKYHPTHATATHNPTTKK